MLLWARAELGKMWGLVFDILSVIMLGGCSSYAHYFISMNHEKYMIDKTILQRAEVLWEYHHMHHLLAPADCIVVLWSIDIRTAERWAQLFLEWYAPFIVFSWWYWRKSKILRNEPEAKKYATRARELGVPYEAILIEDQSTNTGENITLTRQLLTHHWVDPQKFILVHKPYMERRSFATWKAQRPEKEVIISSPRIALSSYPNELITMDDLINSMVWDLHRIAVYPDLWFQIKQDIPHHVWNAYEKLIACWFDKQVL